MRCEDNESIQDYSKVKKVITLKQLQKEISKYIESCKYHNGSYIPYAEKFLVLKNNTVIPIQIQGLRGSRYNEDRHGEINDLS